MSATASSALTIRDFSAIRRAPAGRRAGCHPRGRAARWPPSSRWLRLLDQLRRVARVLLLLLERLLFLGRQLRFLLVFLAVFVVGHRGDPSAKRGASSPAPL